MRAFQNNSVEDLYAEFDRSIEGQEIWNQVKSQQIEIFEDESMLALDVPHDNLELADQVYEKFTFWFEENYALTEEQLKAFYESNGDGVYQHIMAQLT